MLTTTAFAQETVGADEELRDRALLQDDVPDGWRLSLKLGASFSLVDSRAWVGSVEGSAFQLGGLLETNANYRSGPWESDTLLIVQHSQTRAPPLDRFVKSNDTLELVNFLFYSFDSPDWAGAYLRLSLNTQVLAGDYVASDTATVLVPDGAGGSTAETVDADSPFELTKPFEPLTLRQTAGLFANPVVEKALTIKLRAGVGAQETITRDGFVVADDETTAEIELAALSSLTQLGVEGDLSATGELQEGVLSWLAAANIFAPFVSSDGDADNGPNVDLRVGLSAKLSSWLSLDYLFQARRVPQVVDDWQRQNTLLLTAGFDVVEPEPVPEPES
ncbi:MAG: hypothetical protein AAF219_02445 [Myxococcota bacterium]